MSDDFLLHYGKGHLDGGHSGRYPWGSGEDPYQRYSSFLSDVKEQKKAGMTEKEIADFYGMSINTFRARHSIAVNEVKKTDIATAERLRAEGYTYEEIGKQLGGKSESTVRSLLNPQRGARANLTADTADKLKQYVDEKQFIDVGSGAELSLGVTRNRMDNAIAMLEEQGYVTYEMKVDQLGTGHRTTMTVLCKDDVSFNDFIKDHRYDVKPIEDIVFDEDGEIGKLGLEKNLTSVDSKRIFIRYNEDGGIEKDGVIELRPGVDDISLGSAQYAQVRIPVDGKYYLKGMAMYGDIPDGYDLVFNTNKHVGTPMEDVFKKMKKTDSGEIDWDNPFGATIKTQEGEEGNLKKAQRYYIDSKTGERKLSCINVVNEEGNWSEWSKTLASQFLSKQNIGLAKRQLDLSYDAKKTEFDDICALTNPTVKRKLLEQFADGCDSDAVELKAINLPGQKSHVILPFPDMKENEIYAPNYKDGTSVCLVRFPHEGVFQIPRLIVRNHGSVAENVIHNAPDAVGINSKVAEKLSGADFDGDTVLVLPESSTTRIRTSDMLPGLVGFDPKEAYYIPKDDPRYDKVGLKKSEGGDGFNKQQQMGSVSNLITDMTLKGASADEIARATRHSMTIIDTEKHHLDWKRSEEENGIRQLKKKYQGREDAGASTLISKASSEKRVNLRKDTYKIDPVTGKKIFSDATNPKQIYYSTYKKKTVTVDPETGKRKTTWEPLKGKPSQADIDAGLIRETVHKRQTKTTKMAETDDAFTLTSGGSRDNPGTPMEELYANYANNLKGLANKARLELLNTPTLKYDKEARVKYQDQVDSLKTKLMVAKKNAPRERYAQLLANQTVANKKADNPEMDKEHYKRVKMQALNNARNKVGAQKTPVNITDIEWEAIQKGAISDHVLKDILDNTDIDAVKQRAMPRTKTGLSDGQIALAKRMMSTGFTTAEIADRLGVSTSTISEVT